MSDLKNVLKAGFLVTASLLATGCGDDNNKSGTPTPGNNNNGVPGGSNNGGGSGATNLAVSTFAVNINEVYSKLEKGTVKYTPLHRPVVPKGSQNGYGPNYDILANLSTTSAAATPQLGLGKNEPRGMVNLGLYKSTKDESFLFKGNPTPQDPLVYGAILASGYISTAERSVLNAKLEGNLSLDVFVLQNGVLNGSGTAPVLTSKFTSVGVDASIGYASPRQNAKGEAVTLPLNVHSQPAGSTELVKTANLSLSVDPPKAAAPAKTTTSAASSKATNTSKVDSSKANVQNAAVAKPAVVAAKPAGETVLTLKTVAVDENTAKNLTEDGLDIRDKKATVDVGGRIHTLTSSDTFVTAVSDIQPELEIPEAVTKVSPATTAAKTTPTTAAAKKTAAQPGLSLSVDPPKAAGTTSAAAKTAAPAATTAAKNAAPAAKKTQTNATTVAAKSEATAAKPTTSQAVVKTAAGHNFLFQIKEGGLYPEIENWNVGAGTEYAVISHHGLVVHKLNLTENLGLRVLAEDHTFTKLDGATFAGLGSGQALFTALEKDHSLSIENSAVEGGAEKEYAHFDSHTPFPLWVMDGTVATGKHLVLKGIDLAKDGVLVEGVHVMPLAKDFSKRLPDNASAANEKVALALNTAEHTTLEVSEWKVAGNEYFDKVLLINVAKKAVPSLSAGTLDRVLMSAKAQAGRSVASSQLDAVVAKLDPTNLVSTSFANVSGARANQASQFATLARGSSVATAEKLGAVEQYSVAFNHDGVQFGLTYNLDGGNAFTSKSGTTSFGANVATDVLGLKAIVSAEASVDAGKGTFVDAAVASYNAGLTFAKAYNAAGLSVVPMAGFGVSSNALNGYSAVVPMAAGSLGLSMNDVSFSAATFHAGVSVALDDFAAAASGVNGSLTLGVAGYLAANATAKLSTSEGVSTNIAFEGSSATPYAQFNLGLATGESLNALVSTGSVAVNFGFDR